MKILSIDKIERIDKTAIYYIRTYKAIAKIHLPVKIVDLHINFTIETTPLGTSNLIINLTDSLEYPLIPLKKKLATYIKEADTMGKLPC